MPHDADRLRPIRPDVSPARRALAEALRVQFGRLKVSVRAYAAKQGLPPSSVSRYLNAVNLPPEHVVKDLAHEVAQQRGEDAAAETGRLLALHQAAQDAQPGSWGHTKRLKEEAAEARERARVAEAAVEAHRVTVRQLSIDLEELRFGPHDGDSTGRRFDRLVTETEQVKTELGAARAMLAAQQQRIAELEREITRLTAHDNGAAAAQWRPWYRPGDHQRRYWNSYIRTLAAKGWTADAISAMDAATDRVVESLADPSAATPYQAKGMVLAYPQGGEAANVAGLVAKSVDVGYRLVIVLSGPTNLVREQLQRRLDEELPSLPDTSGVLRLTTSVMDYRSLAERLGRLEFEKQFRNRPLYEPENLRHATVRLLVVKKNSFVLSKLVKDLRKIGTALDEVPALVIDVDTGQSSTLNVTRPLETSLAANVAQLLKVLPRAQYVCFATSPLTSAFLDPSGAGQVFPGDFLVSLPRPTGYVGGRDFSDARREAHVRHVEAGDVGLREALDMFALTAAVKVFREIGGHEPFPHHSMFVQGPVLRTALETLASRLDALWQSGGYTEPSGQERLRALFDADVLPVSRLQVGGETVPNSFDALLPSLRDALDRIGGHPVDPDEDIEHEGWKIIVAGHQDELGLADEGPAVAYVACEVKASRGLAGSGRWFGVRPGYHDLVRLYFSQATDVHRALESFWRSEEEVRDDIARHPDLRPRGILPLVGKAAGRARQSDRTEHRSRIPTPHR